MAKEINLTFEGYWGTAIPEEKCNHSGIYVVYGGKNTGEKTCEINRLIYIGESENINTRLSDHERKDDWKKQLKEGEILYFSKTKVTGDDRKQAEAALIYKHQPPCNIEYKDNFPFDTTRVKSSPSDKIAFLKADFTVEKSALVKY